MEHLTLLGVQVTPLTIENLNACIAKAIDSGELWIIANHNLHSIWLYHHDQKMKHFFQKARVVHIDGMPLLYWARLLGYSLNKNQRVTYVDWVYPLMAAAETNGWRVFYLGGKSGIAARAAEILRENYPNLFIETYHGYFELGDTKKVLSAIDSFRPQILMVGMGMPRQEHWVLENLEYLEVNAILTAGACFDYIAKSIPTPPRWMGRIGLEWAYRLWSEPRRLWRRYLLEPWALLPYMATDLIKVFQKRKSHC